MHKQIAFLLLVFTSFSSYSQFSFSLNGFVTDKKTGEALMGVKVSIDAWHVESYTNRYGFFSISSPPQDILITVTYDGYNQQTDSLYIDQDRTLYFELEPAEVSQYEEANPPRNQNEVTDVLGNRIDMPIKFTRKIPYMLGETDLIKGLQVLPGVKFGNEGFSNLFVRGGENDQNLFLLDGMPIYNSNHMFGLLSIYNPEAVNNVQLHKGGFAARYGGRLSSVVDITSNEGSKSGTHGSISLTPISLKLSLSGAFKNNKTTYAISARRSYFDFLLKALFLQAAATLDLNYHDINAKVTHQVSDDDKLYFSFYNGRDLLGTSFTETDSLGTSINQSLRLKWGNMAGSARWNHVFNQKLFASTSVTYSRYGYNENYTEKRKPQNGSRSEQTSDYTNGIQDIIVGSDFEYNLSNTHFIRFGFQSSFRDFNTGLVRETGKGFSNTNDFDRTLGMANHATGIETAIYTEDDYMINFNLKLNGGLRLVNYTAGESKFLKVEPRLSARYLVNNNLSLKASFCRMNQFMHQLSNNGSGSPFIYWVPATDNIKPQQADQISGGFVNTFSNGYQLNVDAYWKQMKNLTVVTDPNAVVDVEQNWERAVDQGEGTSYGLEVLLKKNYGKFTGIYGYTLSKTTRQFEYLNKGEPFAFNFDRRHQLNALIQFWISDVTAISTNLVVGSGNPFTLPVSKYIDIDGRQVLDYGSINNYRPGRYTRFDIGFNRNYGEIADNVTQELNISIYNFFLRKNPSNVFAQSEFDSFGNQLYKAYQQSYFVFLPGIHYIIRF